MPSGRRSPVVYANTFVKKETNNAGNEVEQEIPYLKEYTVFNAEQCEGLPERFYQLAEPQKEKNERIERAEEFFHNTHAYIRDSGNQACYVLNSDFILMPPVETFRDAESYAATKAHELTRWPRHPTRLDRDLGRKKWGDAD